MKALEKLPGITLDKDGNISLKGRSGVMVMMDGNSRSQHDIQEIVDPAGQLSFGISKTILKNQGTLKLAFRDVFYTNWMKGLTQFTNATEYFKVTRDTRVGVLSFTWRFGKAFKTTKRSEGGSGR